jgi:hypothetical protein
MGEDMNHSWMDAISPFDYEPNYDDYIAELESYEEMIAHVESYDDWFVDCQS